MGPRTGLGGQWWGRVEDSPGRAHLGVSSGVAGRVYPKEERRQDLSPNLSLLLHLTSLSCSLFLVTCGGWIPWENEARA